MARDPFPGRHLALSRLRDAGVATVPRLDRVEGKIARFEDGRRADISAVIWATGYRDDTSWINIPAAKRSDGGVIERRGISPVTGLYYVGRSWQWTRGSALVLGVGKDAAYIANQVQATVAANASTTLEQEGALVESVARPGA